MPPLGVTVPTASPREPRRCVRGAWTGAPQVPKWCLKPADKCPSPIRRRGHFGGTFEAPPTHREGTSKAPIPPPLPHRAECATHLRPTFKASSALVGGTFEAPVGPDEGIFARHTGTVWAPRDRTEASPKKRSAPVAFRATSIVGASVSWTLRGTAQPSRRSHRRGFFLRRRLHEEDSKGHPCQNLGLRTASICRAEHARADLDP
jgi:hypothetical protein